MDFDEMRRKYQEQKDGASVDTGRNYSSQKTHSKQEEYSKEKQQLETTQTVPPPTKMAVRHGEKSSVSMTGFYDIYDEDTMTVDFICTGIENQSKWTTGELKVVCLLYHERSIKDHSKNEFEFIDEEILGHLESGYEFTDVKHSFKFSPDNIPSGNYRTKFVFEISELSEEDEWDIIEYEFGSCNLSKDDFNLISSILVDKLGVDASELKMTADLRNDFGADSLDLVELTMEFEKEFGISIPDEEVEDLSTVGDIVWYLKLTL